MSMNLDPEMYRTILESLPAGLYLVDRERRIILWNEGAERITGYLRQEVIGRGCQDNLLSHCDESNNILCGGACPLLGTMHDGKPREAILMLRHKTGARIPVRVRAIPVRDEIGLVIGAVEIFDELHTSARIGSLESTVNDAMEAVSVLAEALSLGHRGEVAVLTIQIEELDQVTARHGRHAADAVVETLAQSICHNLHPGDRVTRCGRGRFVAVLQSCSPGVAQIVAARLHRVVAATSVPWWGDRLSVHVSVGTAVAEPDDTPVSLLDRSAAAIHPATQVKK